MVPAAPVEMRKHLYYKILKNDLDEIDIICKKDALRTFKLKKLFHDMSQPGTQMVFNICKAIGAYFPRAGYCQGKSYNTKVLILYLGLF